MARRTHVASQGRTRVEAGAAQTAAPQTDSLAALLSRPAASAPAAPRGEIVIGRVRAIGADGRPQVTWPGGPAEPWPALSLVPIAAAEVGREVALAFPDAAGSALVLGLLHQPGPTSLQAEVDGRHVAIEAAETITLRCGEASITLTADGQVLLRGSYVSSHATGTQRITGAAVRIN